MADDNRKARTYAAARACTRILSGSRPQTIAEQLAGLSTGEYDLDRPHDIYGDGIVADLETRVAGLWGKPAAAFFPTGTMAQQIALRIWAARTARSTVALHPLHHTEKYERKAYSTLSGLRAIWPTGEPRQPTAEEIRALDEPVAALVVELPLRDPGFLLPTWDELTGICAAARETGARVHFDGARLWESTTHLGHTLPEIAALADSAYTSFYKSLNGIAGAALTGSEDFVAEAKAWRHRHGGQIFEQWPTVLSALIGLDRELPKLHGHVAHARTVAAALAKLPGATVYPNPPHTHQFQLWLPHPADILTDAALLMAEQDRIRFATGWQTEPPGDRSFAEITVADAAHEWSDDDIVDAGTRFLALADGIAAGTIERP